MERRAAGKGLASPRLLRRLAADPVSGMGKRARHGGFARSHSPYFDSAASSVSPAALDSLPSPSPAIPIPTLAVAAAHLTVAAYLVVSAPNFDAAAGALFAPPGGRVRSPAAL
uniref:Uncharacterized protein n=1 Tax=Oryza nivara TaxID=4536 RepID=A0A0E0IB95_ORYNI